MLWASCKVTSCVWPALTQIALCAGLLSNYLEPHCVSRSSALKLKPANSYYTSNMRSLVYLLALAGLTTKSLGQQKQQQPLSATAKPNVVFILTDDQDAHLASLDYMPYVQKHLLDKGTHYRSHYCTTSVCCPSRVTLWTGKLAHNTNVTDVNPPHGECTTHRHLYRGIFSYAFRWLSKIYFSRSK